MALIDEVKAEVIQRHTGTVSPVAVNPPETPKPRRRRKTLSEMTPAEIEEFRRRKMEEEEAKVLGESEHPRKRRRRKATQEQSEPEKQAQSAKPQRRQKQTQKTVKVPRQRRQPKQEQRCPTVLQPMRPQFVLRLPECHKGDLLVISMVPGTEAK